MTSRANPSDVLAIFAKTFKKFRAFKGMPLLERLVHLLVGKDVPAAKADAVLDRLKKEWVDWNEVRLARIDDVRTIVATTGAPNPEVRAIRLRDLLTKVFTERHALDVEHLRAAEEKDRPKKQEERTLFLAGLPGLDFAQLQAFEASVAEEAGDIPVSPQAIRVAQRLGWIAAVGGAKAKKVLLDAADGDPVNLTYGLVRIAEEHCFPRNPSCPTCPLNVVCPTGKRVLRGGTAKLPAAG